MHSLTYDEELTFTEKQNEPKIINPNVKHEEVHFYRPDLQWLLR